VTRPTYHIPRVDANRTAGILKETVSLRIKPLNETRSAIDFCLLWGIASVVIDPTKPHMPLKPPSGYLKDSVPVERCPSRHLGQAFQGIKSFSTKQMDISPSLMSVELALETPGKATLPKRWFNHSNANGPHIDPQDNIGKPASHFCGPPAPEPPGSLSPLENPGSLKPSRPVIPSATSSFLTKGVRRKHGVDDFFRRNHTRFVMDGLTGSAGL
jgi:hypothetical protein